MSIIEIVQSSGWKSFMSKLYGWGASIVIVGALFKIQHWPLAGTFLTVGLLTEAIIFFFSAFEPLHEEVDWTLVYPELAGITDEEIEQSSTRVRKGNVLEDILGNSEITPEVFDKLGQGLTKLSETSSKLADISEASVVTNEYIGNLKNASTAVHSMSDSYTRSTETLNSSVQSLTGSYQKTSEALGKTEEIFNGTNQALNESLTRVSNSGKSYGDQLEVLNKNMSALNAVYELQLQGSNEHVKKSEQIYQGFETLMKNLQESVQDTQKYKDEVSKLTENLNALNTVYGNMLAAMNTKA